MNKLVLDIETGGFSPKKNGLCSIGAIVVNLNNEIISKHYWLIKPYTKVDSNELMSYKEDSMAVNKLKIDELKSNGQDITSVLEELISIIAQHFIISIIGHNVIKFDLPWIEELFKRFIGSSPIFANIYDTMVMAKDKGHDIVNLEHLSKHYNIENNQTHNAINDCEVTLELFKKLIS